MSATPYDELGGEPKLRAIIEDFVGRVFSDVMIGFFFAKVNQARLAEMEFQLAAQFLGAGTEYHGRPLDEAHKKHPIMGGQFARRAQILKETLADHDVPGHIVDAWLEHTERLRPLITSDAGSDCDPDALTS